MIRMLAISAAVLTLSACSSIPAGGGPATVSVPMSHYSGTWLEIARRPMMITHNCVAGYTTYTPGADGDIAIEDGCHKDIPNGKLKTITGDGTLTDAGGANAKLRVKYPLFITRDYWVLYEAPDHSWFISSDPAMGDLYIYARSVPSDALRAEMTAKAKSLGYDVTKLEYPAQ